MCLLWECTRYSIGHLTKNLTSFVGLKEGDVVGLVVGFEVGLELGAFVG